MNNLYFGTILAYNCIGSLNVYSFCSFKSENLEIIFLKDSLSFFYAGEEFSKKNFINLYKYPPNLPCLNIFKVTLFLIPPCFRPLLLLLAGEEVLFFLGLQL
jgi:hypothetical protein